jgi:RNA polymerase sigma factor (sigma-70 family)
VHANESGFPERLARAREGDPVAWSDLYHGVAPLVIGYLRAQRLPDPEDVAGEVMLEVVRGIERFRGDAAGFRSWVLTIAHHRLLDSRRRQTRRPSTPRSPDDLDAPPATDDVEAEVIADLGFGRLEPALAELTDEQRNVLLLRVIGDLSIAEVARIVDKRPGAVKQLQRRATASMRRHLDTPRAGDPAPGPSTASSIVRDHHRATADGRANGSTTGPELPASDGRTGRDVAPSGDASSARWTT